MGIVISTNNTMMCEKIIIRVIALLAGIALLHESFYRHRMRQLPREKGPIGYLVSTQLCSCNE